MKREQRASFIASLPPDVAASWYFDWDYWARPSQREPDGTWWRYWLAQAGRGWGKTRVGAEWIRAQAERKACRRMALVARTAADARDVMIEGQSGILAISPPWFRPKYEPSKRRLTWPNGVMATTYSADEPDLLRGPQHDGAWADELASWRYPDAWDQLLFGLRLGRNPRAVVTTTPRPTPTFKLLCSDPLCAVTRGKTGENAENLSPIFIDTIMRRFRGTRLGRQELDGDLLEDVPGALWKRSTLDEHRVRVAPTLVRIVVALDPAATSTEDSDESGILVGGLGDDGHGYVLDDLSGRMSPEEWGSVVVSAYHKRGADRVVAETNNGGEMVERVLRVVDPTVSYRALWASRGKTTRAEPVAALYEQGRVHHVGDLGLLEDELCSWVHGDASPNRLDALVWLLTELMLEQNAIYVGAA